MNTIENINIKYDVEEFNGSLWLRLYVDKISNNELIDIHFFVQTNGYNSKI